MECPENGWNYSKLAGIAAVFRSTQVPFQHGFTAGKHARQRRWQPEWEKAHRSRQTGAHGRQTQPWVIPEANIKLLNRLTGTGNRFFVRVGLHGSLFFRYIPCSFQECSISLLGQPSSCCRAWQEQDAPIWSSIQPLDRIIMTKEAE